MPTSNVNVKTRCSDSARLAAEALALYREQQTMASVIANRAKHLNHFDTEALSDSSLHDTSSALLTSIAYVKNSLRQNHVEDKSTHYQLDKLNDS
jgi:hypothetical protein